MARKPDIVEGSERDFGYAVREDGVYSITVGYLPNGDKVKVAETKLTGAAARRLALVSVYGDVWTDEQEDAFAKLEAEHGVGGAAVRLRYVDFDDRTAAYDARLAEIEEAAA